MPRLPDSNVVGPFGALLDMLRGQMTITDFAEKCGVGQTDITKYRKGGLPTPGNLAEMKRRPFLSPHAKDLDRAYAERAKQQAEESMRSATADGEPRSHAAELADSIMARAPEPARNQFVNALQALDEMLALGPRADLGVFRYLADLSSSAWRRSKERPNHSATWTSTPPEEATG